MEPDTETKAGFTAGEILGASSTGRELAAVAADVGAERLERRRWRRETAGAEGAEMKRKTEFVALSTGS